MFNSSKREERKKEYEKNVLENWHTRREGGKWAFVFKFGVLTWGGVTFVLYWLLLSLLNWLTKAPTDGLIYQLITSVAIFIIFGVVYGIVLWTRNEKIYLKKFPYSQPKKKSKK